jgi:hypothetical protein
MRSAIVRKALRRRFAVTLTGGEGSFGGVLTEADDHTLVFEQCQTVPNQSDETPTPIRGRVFVDRISVAYLQELTGT